MQARGSCDLQDSFDRKDGGQGQIAQRVSASRASFYDLLPRLTSALALMVLALGSVWLGGKAFVVIWLAATLALSWEWQEMIGGPAKILRHALGFAGLALVAVLLWFGHPVWSLAATGVTAGGLAVAAAERAGWAASGFLYAGGFFAALCLLAVGPAGGVTILWLFAVVWGTDVFAYFGGRFFGGPKIWPRFSPKKTWSGTIVGLGMGAVLGTALTLILKDAPVSILHSLVISLAVAAISQGGDVFESWMKRRFGVKDSSRLIPGHGGFMDRLDGFVAAVLLAFLLGLAESGGNLSNITPLY